MLKHISIIFTAIAFVTVSCDSSGSGPADDGDFNELLTPGWHDDQTITINGDQRFYRYYIPDSLSAVEPPVVFFLHGGNQSMRESMPPARNGAAAWPDVAEKHGFILMVPNGTNPETGDASGDQQRWNDCRINAPDVNVSDVDFLSSLMDWSITNLNVDRERMYVTGASNGGFMSFRAATELPDKVAAIAPFIANKSINSECPPASPTPIMITVGTEDPLTPFEGGEVAGTGSFVVSADSTRNFWVQLNGITSEPATTTFPDIVPDDESVVEEELFENANGTLAVRYLRMVGAGHSMPSTTRELRPSVEAFLGPQNNDIEGAEQAWLFMSQFENDG